jgi:hypothetical protein
LILPITYAEILGSPNARELLEEYSAECALPELGPTNPQAETYAAMERTGNFQCFGAYEAGSLLGFAAPLTYVVPHYGTRIATVESLFMAAAHRGWMGGKLMRAIEEHSRAQGCAAMLYSAPVGSRLARLLFQSEPEYRNCSHVFIKRLK